MPTPQLRLVGGFGLALLGAFACQPDLGALTAGYSGGTGGASGSSSANGGSGETSGKVDSGGSSQGDAGGDLGGNGGSSGADEIGGEGGATTPPPPEPCENDAKDSNESDVDCGGSSKCDRCENDQRCAHDDDCDSGFCKSKRCAKPTCDDGFKNQDETETDCGGSHCDSCGCRAPEECSSGVCTDRVCQTATCSDGVKNQDEGDRDCGGVCTTTPCQIDDTCNTGSDCASYVCTDGHCVADLPILDDDVIDYFEDQNLMVDSAGDRIGSWYVYGDGNGSATYSVTRIDGNRGSASAYGIHTTGSGFTNWGSGVGADINNAGGSQQSKLPYDASAYTGVTFWARAEASTTMILVLPDKYTDAAGGICVVCDHHYLKALQIDTTWRRYVVPFSELNVESGGDPAPPGFSADGVVSVQFRFSPFAIYDVWIDDVAFVR